MACKNVCRLCKKLIISTGVAFTSGNLVITIPSGSYLDGEKYCIVVAQAIPTTTTINAPVVIRIGSGTELYPLNQCDCTQATACAIHTRTKYSTRVSTSPTTGSFRLLENVCCNNDYNRTSIDGNVPT